MIQKTIIPGTVSAVRHFHAKPDMPQRVKHQNGQKKDIYSFSYFLLFIYHNTSVSIKTV